MTKTKITLGIIGIITIFGVYFAISTFFYPNMMSRGQFGDTFGGLNTLFSGFAFLGIIYTILLQREELSLQRTELELTRQELQRTAAAQEKSEQALSKQAASLKATAKLNALGAQLSYKSSLIEAMSSDKYGRETSQIAPNIQREAERIIVEIKTLTEDK